LQQLVPLLLGTARGKFHAAEAFAGKLSKQLDERRHLHWDRCLSMAAKQQAPLLDCISLTTHSAPRTETSQHISALTPNSVACPVRNAKIEPHKDQHVAALALCHRQTQRSAHAILIWLQHVPALSLIVPVPVSPEQHISALSPPRPGAGACETETFDQHVSALSPPRPGAGACETGAGACHASPFFACARSLRVRLPTTPALATQMHLQLTPQSHLQLNLQLAPQMKMDLLLSPQTKLQLAPQAHATRNFPHAAPSVAATSSR
jgi:hypothetical protein